MHRTLVRASDRNTELGSEDSNPGLQDQNLACNAGYTTPQRRREAYPGAPLPVRVGAIRVVLRRPHPVALAVLRLGPVVLGHPLLVGLGRGAARVLGAVDELGLGQLEPLRLAAAGLLDGPPRGVGADAGAVRVVVVARIDAGLAADVGGLGGGRLLLLALEFALAFHGWFLPHGAVRPNRR